jgi:L-iditol 2-dehydrogenase
VPAILARELDGGKADFVVECSGAQKAINEGISLLRKDGKFLALGIAPEDAVKISFNTALLNALTIVFSCTSSHSSWKTALEIMERQHTKINSLITNRYPLEEWETAFKMLEERKAIKCLLYP